jgi:hypothetical protein
MAAAAAAAAVAVVALASRSSFDAIEVEARSQRRHRRRHRPIQCCSNSQCWTLRAIAVAVRTRQCTNAAEERRPCPFRTLETDSIVAWPRPLDSKRHQCDCCCCCCCCRCRACDWAKWEPHRFAAKSETSVAMWKRRTSSGELFEWTADALKQWNCCY